MATSLLIENGHGRGFPGNGPTWANMGHTGPHGTYKNKKQGATLFMYMATLFFPLLIGNDHGRGLPGNGPTRDNTGPHGPTRDISN